jgi:hypothetical protein
LQLIGRRLICFSEIQRRAKPLIFYRLLYATVRILQARANPANRNKPIQGNHMPRQFIPPIVMRRQPVRADARKKEPVVVERGRMFRLEGLVHFSQVRYPPFL